MSKSTSLMRALLALTLALPPVGASAAPIGSPTGPTHLDFTVFRNGDPIGHHEITVEQTADSETVAIKTNIVVEVAYIPVYRFEHTGREVWRNGRLISLRSKTNDDGDKHTLDVSAKADHLDVDGDGATSSADVNILPASLWNHDIVGKTILLNTLTGKQMSVAVSDLGADTITAHGATIAAHHYKLTGDLKRELWYDQSNTLVQVKLKAKDDSDILYVLS